ncbi:MAG: HAMP domain-containing histidine kinase, partial [Desulfobacterales bacterium]|nr:HAMP domain-containing histidine kinase [Desulfobacterales bacterium]
RESLEVQRRFTADAAHELRTPLTAIKLQLEMLQRAETESERAELELNLVAGVDRATKLIESLLMLSRHEVDTLAMETTKVDPGGLVKETLEEIMPIAQERGTQIFFEDRSQIGTIEVQPRNLSLVIKNLLLNAVLYTHENGSVRIELSSTPGTLVVSVEDNGPGIRPEERHRVFDRFYRCRGTGVDGSGLGLAIVKNIVEYYQGTISIEDGLHGGGCRFVIRLPVN